MPKHPVLTTSVLNLIAQFFHQNVPTGGSTCRWQNQQWSKCSVTCGVGFQTRKKYLETPVPPNVDPRDIDFEECGNKTFEDTRPCFGPKCTGSTIKNYGTMIQTKTVPVFWYNYFF